MGARMARGRTARIFVVLLFLLAASLWLRVLLTAPAAVTSGTPFLSATAWTQPRMVTIGDSYSAGSTADGNTSGGWPAIVAKQLGYQVVNTAIPGTGYVQGGPRNTPYAAQLAPAVAARPSLVLLSGGSRDGSNPGVGPAATSLLGELRSRLPTAKIVVVGVIWPDANPPTSSVDENNALRAAARLAGLPFVDALPANWLNPSLVGSEEGRPTRAGDQVLARRVLQDLARLGIGPTPATAASAAPR